MTPPDAGLLSINTATVRGAMGLAGNRRRACAPRHPRHLAVARPGRGNRASTTLRDACAMPGSTVTATAAAACSRRPTAERRRAALDDNRRAVDEAATLGARCLVLVVGGLPGTTAVRSYRRTSPARAHDGARRHRRTARVCAHSAACRSRSSRCTRCTPPTAPASTRCEQALRPLRRARARRQGGLGVAVDVYHVWWDPKLEAQIARAGARAPSRLPRLRLAGAHDATC